MDSPALVYDRGYVADLGAHVFPAQKYRLVSERLIQEGIAAEEDFVPPRPIEDEDVLRVHDRGYVERIETGRLSAEEMLRLEVPYSSDLVRAVWLATGGTLLAAELALARRAAFNLSGGFHHAFADHGEGFCLVNDVAIAVRALRARGKIARAAVLDADVHQGNGTASIFAGEEETFTFSIHQQNNYPFEKPPSDVDIGLPDEAGDEMYLGVLRRRLPELYEKGRPDVLLYLAGADPHRDDRLGGLALTRKGLAERDRLVFESARNASVPVAVVLAGGYGIRPEETVAIHVETVRQARDVFVRR